MKSLLFTYKNSSLVTEEQLQKTTEKLKSEVEGIRYAREQEYRTQYASLHCPFDERSIALVQEVANEKKTYKPTILVVIGIGGSNLGTIAVQEAIYGLFYNDQQPDIKVYFVDTVDTDYVYDIMLLVAQEFEKENNVIINVVSKSGTTTETIANFELFYEQIKAIKPDFNEYIVATTDEGSKLWNFAQKNHITRLPIPKHVGGRYSVFSAVGLFPLALLDIDITQLCEGARNAVEHNTQTDIALNMSALSAAILAAQYTNGFSIHDTFVFSKDLRSIGDWYRQLLAESIGKEQNRAGERVNIGLTPTVSVGSTDLHSVGQLYLGGPYNKFTTFISVGKNKSNLVLPEFQEFDQLVKSIQGKTLLHIMNAILQGTKKAYLNDKRPFVEIIIPEKNAYYIGQLMQMKMLEVMYLGALLDVNPFDQPNVENYKKETRAILK